MKVLMIGDVVGSAGCEFLRAHLPDYKRRMGVELVIANGENSAVGNGILPSSADYLFDSGVDVLTGGNHSFKRREILDYLDEHENLLRPYNYPFGAPGNGITIVDGGSWRAAVLSLLGQVFLDPIESPFAAADRILSAVHADFILVDFHAEATGEKLALGYYLDGRVSAVVGTHTHVQTADEQILPKGTGYISDLGMTGPVCSILGMNPECIVKKMTTQLPTRFTIAQGPCKLEGVLLELEKKTGKCTKISRVKLTE